MAPRPRKIVPAERLRDQVYNIILAEIRSGELQPGQRLYEVELAEKYGVSRTPIREALFQLARDGLLVESERGYVFPKDTMEDVTNRLEVRSLLDTRIAFHAASEATAAQIKALGQALEKEKATVDAQDTKGFTEASAKFRFTLRSMCSNKLLVRCANMVDDQFQFARSVIFRDSPYNRHLTIEYHEKILKAIKARKPEQAEKAVHDFLLRLRKYFDEHPPESE